MDDEYKNKLEYLRRKYGTWEGVASALNVSERTIYYWRENKYNPSSKNKEQITKKSKYKYKKYDNIRKEKKGEWNISSYSSRYDSEFLYRNFDFDVGEISCLLYEVDNKVENFIRDIYFHYEYRVIAIYFDILVDCPEDPSDIKIPGSGVRFFSEKQTKNLHPRGINNKLLESIILKGQDICGDSEVTCDDIELINIKIQIRKEVEND